ncbi:MAG TPA: ATP-binding cassette domain-containing protein [Caldisericia bacterium]|mgnify:CR=1 FL=1|nr:ATP-binding cassette domain-containing protein [Caldisericia bacterium]OQB73275.1 MAG: Oligopeptide transport ATP-binding protein OppF [bacterium ADurb.Bin132]HNW32383.1 ATP-binding cassette domain-containing protein [Caldisericia bacterium]HNY61792.1 ATP-binding cassette domain-containing protein [Caldisericia bacterium]HOC79380.1 ATP-binding cassette domain-containing protein [Caldisericia bacterium]
MNNLKPLLEVKGLKKHFPITGGLLGRTVGYVKAVDGVTFDIMDGETLSLVGESGSGKTTTGKAILRLNKPTTGSVLFEDEDILGMKGEKMRRMRRKMQIIFQDPYGSLNPRLPVGEIIGEPLVVHNLASRKEREEQVMEIMETVGLRPEYLHRYPHEFSGGQRQRIGIARALILQPKFIVCDEPVSALDVSIQSQVINLLQELQSKFKLTYLFVAHDMAVVRHMSDRIAVMYLGKIVELASGEELFKHPLHPYTKALLEAVPVPDPEKRKERSLLEGDIPSPINPPSGCRFHTRCKYYAQNKFPCEQGDYELVDIGNGHFTACPYVRD